MQHFQNLCYRYIWGGKRQRIRRAILKKQRTQGGLGVPDFYTYYLATQVRQAIQWSFKFAYTKWMEIEKLALAPIHPSALLWTSQLVKLGSLAPRTILFTKQIWSKCKNRLGPTDEASFLTPFLFHEAFPLGLEKHFVQLWQHTVAYQLVHLFDTRTKNFLDKQQLIERHGLSELKDYMYFQLRHYVKSVCRTMKLPELTLFERLCTKVGERKGHISLIYKELMTHDPESHPHSYMQQWDRDLGTHLSIDQWERIWINATKTSICTTIKENIYKVLFRWYHTPALLHKLFPAVPPVCWKCGETPATLFHMFWTCPRVVTVWYTVQVLVKKAICLDLPSDPLTYLLGHPVLGVGKRSQKILNCIFTAARCLIAARWKDPVPPSLWDLVNRIEHVRRMEYMTAILHGTSLAVGEDWFMWNSYYKELHDKE